MRENWTISQPRFITERTLQKSTCILYIVILLQTIYFLQMSFLLFNKSDTILKFKLLKLSQRLFEFYFFRAFIYMCICLQYF